MQCFSVNIIFLEKNIVKTVNIQKARQSIANKLATNRCDKNTFD